MGNSYVILTPAYRGLFSMGWVNTIQALTSPEDDAPWTPSGVFIADDHLIPARNQLIERALASEASIALWIDADIGLDFGVVDNVLAARANPVMRSFHDGLTSLDRGDDTAIMAAAYPCRDGTSSTKLVGHATRVQRHLVAGLGFTAWSLPWWRRFTAWEGFRWGRNTPSEDYQACEDAHAQGGRVIRWPVNLPVLHEGHRLPNDRYLSSSETDG